MDDVTPLIRVLAALVAGLAIGLERALRGRPAGIRTHVLVAVGAAAFTLAGAYGFADLVPGPQADPSRVAAQVASGIGFIGAGAILRDGASVKGLTTAATLWISASLGVLAGAGAYAILVTSTAAVLLTLLALPWIQPSRWVARQRVKLRLRCVAQKSTIPSLIRALAVDGAEIRSLEMRDRPKHGRCDIVIGAAFRRSTRIASVVSRLSELPDVIEVSAKERRQQVLPDVRLMGWRLGRCVPKRST